jgi:hypothetical protein
MKKETLPVIFRKFKDGEVIAFFPTMVESFSPWECGSYMHIGQHSVASTELITLLDKCNINEYAPLLNELKTIYDHVQLEVVNRSNKTYYNSRMTECRKLLKSA